MNVIYSSLCLLPLSVLTLLAIVCTVMAAAVSCLSFVLASSPTELRAMDRRPAWIIHEQQGRVAGGWRGLGQQHRHSVTPSSARA